MTSFYDEIEIEASSFTFCFFCIADFEYDEDEDIYFYPCPCGDRFQITKEELQDGEDIARCPSCSLLIRVIYDPDDFVDEDDEESTFTLTAIADALPEPVAA
ncbi:Diphthamide biosynthesis protein 3 [Haplosporangium sp. Z 11]|nr:Diphthamide biosynthesis protein 3 [Haplosporangium sp. Z 11]